MPVAAGDQRYPPSIDETGAVAQYFVNKDLNEGEPNDSQSSGQGQEPATPGVFFGFGLLFLACAAWALVHAVGTDGNAGSWVGFALSLVAAALFFFAGIRKRVRSRRRSA